MPKRKVPHIVRSVNNWYVSWYDQNGNRKRTYGEINSQLTKQEKEAAAQSLLAEIEGKINSRRSSSTDQLIIEKLNSLFDEVIGLRKKVDKLEGQKQKKKEADRELRKTLLEMTRIKCLDKRPDTINSYNSKTSLFVKWIDQKGYAKIRVHEFTTDMAQAYMDKCATEDNLGAFTYNTYLSYVRGLFSLMLKRKYISENPFDVIKRKRKVKSSQYEFLNQAERKSISEYYREKYPWAYKALLLQFYCLIRPRELQRMKFSQFDLQNGIIRVTEDTAKTHKFRTPTIPNLIRDEFFNENFLSYDPNWYVFGKNLLPGPMKSGKNQQNILHDGVLNILGINRQGLSWYCWKHTGATLMDRVLSPSELKNHGGWHSYEVMEHYLHRPQIIESVRELPNLL